MNADLEKELDELGTDYRVLVNRLRASEEASSPRDPFAKVRLYRRFRTSLLVAASVSLLFAVSVLCLDRGNVEGPVFTVKVTDPHTMYTLAYRQSAAAIDAMLASQRPDGSWENDFITRQNAAALRNDCPTGVVSVAYRKAVRYLRAKGMRPLTDEELRQRGTKVDAL